MARILGRMQKPAQLFNTQNMSSDEVDETMGWYVDLMRETKPIDHVAATSAAIRFFSLIAPKEAVPPVEIYVSPHEAQRKCRFTTHVTVKDSGLIGKSLNRLHNEVGHLLSESIREKRLGWSINLDNYFQPDIIRWLEPATTQGGWGGRWQDHSPITDYDNQLDFTSKVTQRYGQPKPDEHTLIASSGPQPWTFLPLRFRENTLLHFIAYKSQDKTLFGSEAVERKVLDKVTAWLEMAKHCHGLFMHPEKIVILDRPQQFHVDSEYRLSNPDGPAVQYRDKKVIYAIAGVTAPSWLVKTAAENLKPESVISIPNAEVRRVAVEKIGLDRLIAGLKAEEIDRQIVEYKNPNYVESQGGTKIKGYRKIKSEYELVQIIVDHRRMRFLKMNNPSTGSVHVEGVPPEISTVVEALKWRNGTNELPEVLT